MDDEVLGFWTRTVWSHPAVSAPNRLFLLGLAYLVNPAGNVTTTQGTIADLLDVNVITVRRALKTCERHGWIEIQPRATDRQGARDGLTYQLVGRTQG